MGLRGPLVLGLMLVLARSAGAQKAEADAAFRRGKELMAKGDTAGACGEFETSMRLEPLNGTLYNLALCHEQLGKIASAWTELKELADNDTNTARAKDATKRAAALAKKLTRMRIDVASPADGLVIKRNDLDVTPLAGQEVPVDPDHYTFVATAPGKRPVTVDIDLRAPGQTVAVRIPELVDDGAATPDQPSTTAPDVSPFALSLVLRPLALPNKLAEADVHAEWMSSDSFEQDPIDTVIAGRMGFGRIEAQLALSIHTRYEEVTATRPTLIRYVAVGANYVISPLFTAGVAYRRDHVLGGDIDQGGEFRGGVTRKRIVTPKLAAIGFGGISFETSSTRGSEERNEFALAGNGAVQFAPLSRLSLDAVANLLLNLGGTLRDETLRLDVGAGVSVAVDPRTDVYARVLFAVAPSSDERTYLFGVSRRLP